MITRIFNLIYGLKFIKILMRNHIHKFNDKNCHKNVITIQRYILSLYDHIYLK